MDVICVGNELLIGKTLNTNAQWLAKQVTSLGGTVRRITVVADDLEEIAAAVREALYRKSRFILTTGGLGPTFDDKTLEGIALALNRKLEVNAEALQMVKDKYAAYARAAGLETVDLTPARLKMATIPERATPVPNPVGTAPAVRVDLNESTLVALPGVPAEMEAIFTESVVPLLSQAVVDEAFQEKSIFVEGIMESSLAPLIDRVMHDNVGVYIKSHPKGEERKPCIEIHFSIRGKKEEKLEDKLRIAVVQLSRLVKENKGIVYNAA